MNTMPLLKIRPSLVDIVENWTMPKDTAIRLLVAAYRHAEGETDMPEFANEVAQARRVIDEDFQGASAQLAGWIDQANKIIDG